jgi:phosphorylase/glycogen(starch) synthase
VGGIYTVISSKAQFMNNVKDFNYFLIGPWIEEKSNSFKIQNNFGDPLLRFLDSLIIPNVKLYIGKWKIPGEPYALLLDTSAMFGKLDEIKREFEDLTGMKIPPFTHELERFLLFGYGVYLFFIEVR